MVQITLQDSVAAALTAQAEVVGLTLDAYLTQLAASGPRRKEAKLTWEEFERLLDEATVAGPEPNCTFTREEIYRDHD